MPQPSTLKINEIFWSFQGEGARLGFSSIFIRLSGCSYGCPYCDTKDSWQKGTEHEIDEILSRVDRVKASYGQPQVVITGGEPLEQDISALVSHLKQKGYFIAIETNGGHFQDIPIDWWTVSPKDVAQYLIHQDLYIKACEVKLVVNDNLTSDIVHQVRGVIPSAPIFLQPDGSIKSNRERFEKTFLLFRECQEMGIENVRAGIQLHKIYNVS